MDDASKTPEFAGLAPRALEDFSHRQDQDGVRIGFEYYCPREKPSNAIGIELGILNGTDEAIQVLPTDFAFTYQGRPVKSAQLEFDAAAPRLLGRGLSFMDWLGISGSPAVPHEVVLFMPVNLLLTVISPANTARVLRDFLAWRRAKAALRKASFGHEAVPAGQFRHGLLHFQVEITRKQCASWREDLDLTIDVLHHRRGALEAEEAVPYRFKPYLPSIPITVLFLALQFACIAGSCFGLEWIVWGGSNALPFVCGGGYLAVALLAILGLVFDYR